MELKIAFIQILPGKDLDENLTKGLDACREAKEKGADVALFPEMWSDGYYLPQDENELKSLAVDKDSAFVLAFSKLAAELQMAIGITFLEAHEPKPLNSIIFFDRTGKEILHYSKVQTCAFADERVLDGGEDFYVADLDLGRGKVKFGSMICFDREFPESARILMLKGAEVILAANACPLEINRLAALRTRAYENMVAVATCNYPEGQPDCNGRSTLFDGVPWLRDAAGVRDMCVFEAPREPGVYVASLDLDLLRKHRSEDIMGDKYRRPEKYGILSDPTVKDVIGGEFVPWYMISDAEEKDLQEILELQYLAYQSEAALFGTRDIPPLKQTLDEVREEYKNGLILKMTDEDGRIIGSVRAHENEGTLYIGKLMVYPGYRRKGYATRLLTEIESRYPDDRYELFTSTRSLDNIRLYQKLGYRMFAHKRISDELEFVYMENCPSMRKA